MRACPRSDGCLAFDSSSRVLILGRAAASAAPPAMYIGQLIELPPRRELKKNSTTPGESTAHEHECECECRDRPLVARACRLARGPQLPAHQPHPAPLGHTLYGLVQPHREPGHP